MPAGSRSGPHVLVAPHAATARVTAARAAIAAPRTAVDAPTPVQAASSAMEVPSRVALAKLFAATISRIGHAPARVGNRSGPLAHVAARGRRAATDAVMSVRPARAARRTAA